MSDRDIRDALNIAEADPHIVALVVERAADLAEQLATDARAAGEHPWSNAAARGHRIAAEWLRWLADELGEDGADTPAASSGSQGEDHIGVRARVAEALFVEPDTGAAPQVVDARRMEAAHRAYAVMTVVGPELAARDRRYAEARQEADGLARELDAAQVQLASARSVLSTWEYRTHHGDSGPMDLLADLQAALSARPAATPCGCGHPVADHWGESASGRAECMTGGCACGGATVRRGSRSPDAMAAATWPSRAARRLEADAHPTAERSGR